MKGVGPRSWLNETGTDIDLRFYKAWSTLFENPFSQGAKSKIDEIRMEIKQRKAKSALTHYLTDSNRTTCWEIKL